LAIELDRFGKNFSKAGQKVGLGALLAVDARNFYYPADPPIAVLFQHRCVFRVHK
jgi:hypothetical protein